MFLKGQRVLLTLRKRPGGEAFGSTAGSLVTAAGTGHPCMPYLCWPSWYCWEVGTEGLSIPSF